MIFGNLNSVLEGEQSIMEAVQSVMGMGGQSPKQRKISKILKSLSSYGMNYDEKLYKNLRAVPADKNLQDKEDQILNQAVYNGMLNNWKVKGEEDKAFAEKTLEQKREVLHKMSMQPELEDILDIMANECIVYDDNNAYIANPFLDTALIQELNEKSAEEINHCINSSFYKIYMLLKLKTTAWDKFKQWLIDGVIAFLIVYDDIKHPKSVVDIVPVDPNTLTKSIDPQDGTVYWVQFKDIQNMERKLLDAEVIYIKYEDSGVSSRQSYLERLIRPFNIYRIVEQAQVIWTVTQSSFKTLFTIPVGQMSRMLGTQTLNAAMNRYKEDISFNAETGELQVNGKMNMPFNKEYWMPENENGKPEIETLVDNGPTLNDSDQLKYFENKLYKMSKIPQSRFDYDAQTTWFGSDPTSTLRDEINFGRFVTRLRNTFSEIILKPLRIQLSLSIPDIKNDKRILDAISLQWNSYNVFEEMMEIEINTKRIEYIQTLKDGLATQDKDGNDVPYFDIKFLLIKYLKMSEADIELNEKYKNIEKADKLEKKKDKGDDKDGESDGGEDEGGDDSDLDDEMFGDVQPESDETSGL